MPSIISSVPPGICAVIKTAILFSFDWSSMDHFTAATV
jgi:hypothetical protein